MHGGKGYLSNLEARYREETGIPKLKIGFNKVFGYYIEVSRSYTDSVPDTFTRKQTLTTGERYITPELKELEKMCIRDRCRNARSSKIGLAANTSEPAKGAASPSANSPHSSAAKPPCKAKQTRVNQPKYWNVPPSAAASGRHSTASSGIESVYATLTPCGALTACVTPSGQPGALLR